MTVYLGKDAYALIGKETTYGTAVTASKDVGLITKVDFTQSNELKRIQTVGQRNAAQIVPTLYKVSGNITATYQHARLIEYALGTVTHDDTTYTPDILHTFTEASTIPSATLEVGEIHSSDQRKYTINGVKANGVKFTVAKDTEAQISVDYIGKSITVGTTAGTGVVSSLPVFIPAIAYLKWDGTEISTVQNFEVNISNDLKEIRAIHSREIQELPASTRPYEVTFSVIAGNDTALETDFLGGTTPQDTLTAKSLVIGADNGVAAASGKRSIEFTFANAKIQQIGTPIDIGGGETIRSYTAWPESLTNVVTYDNIASTDW